MPRVLLVGALICAGCGAASAPTPSKPPPVSAVRPTPAPSLSVQLVDGKTREILAGVTATVTGPRGSWEGRADAEGGVHVPYDIIADELVVKVKGYEPVTVNRNSGRRPKRVVTVRLKPE